jgi:hypothetical protein
MLYGSLRDFEKGIDWRVHETSIDFGDAILGSIAIGNNLSNKEALKILQHRISHTKEEWIYFKKNGWFIDLDQVKTSNAIRRRVIHQSLFPLIEGQPDRFLDLNSLAGIIPIHLDVEIRDKDNLWTDVTFTVTSKQIMEAKPKKIFLSHKGADKPVVKEYFHILKTLGFDPWLDQESMPAGTELHRGIQKGLKESCAAIFFITPNYQDERYLAKEVDYAIEEKLNKGEHFAIIALVMPGFDNESKIPPLLSPYVYIKATSSLHALQEIIKALPIELGEPTFK